MQKASRCIKLKETPPRHGRGCDSTVTRYGAVAGTGGHCPMERRYWNTGRSMASDSASC